MPGFAGQFIFNDRCSDDVSDPALFSNRIFFCLKIAIIHQNIRFLTLRTIGSSVEGIMALDWRSVVVTGRATAQAGFRQLAMAATAFRRQPTGPRPRNGLIFSNVMLDVTKTLAEAACREPKKQKDQNAGLMTLSESGSVEKRGGVAERCCEHVVQYSFKRPLLIRIVCQLVGGDLCLAFNDPEQRARERGGCFFCSAGLPWHHVLHLAVHGIQIAHHLNFLCCICSRLLRDRSGMAWYF